MGHFAFLRNAHGSNNSAFGANCGLNLNSGSGNTFIGSNVDLSGSLYGATNNIAIGTGDGIIRAQFDSSSNWNFNCSNVVFSTTNNTAPTSSTIGTLGQIIFDNSLNMYHYNGVNWIRFRGTVVT